MADLAPTSGLHEGHGSYASDVIDLEDVTLLICQTCHFIEAHCRHVKISWNNEGAILTCDFCGIDGT